MTRLRSTSRRQGGRPRPARILAFGLAVLVLAAAGSGTAAQKVTLTGSLQGASCVHYQRPCPKSEAHLAIENDFVLLLEDGNHYFLPNLSRVTKARFATRQVRVTGDQGAHEIWVEKLEVKSDNGWREVWNLKQQQELYEGGGG